MAISINWENRIINVPRLDLTLLQSTPTEIRQLDIDSFRKVLRDLEDSPEGMVYLPTHTHNSPVSLGDISIARVIEIINDYTITFEDGQYAVSVTNGNSNIGDVVNVNQVSVRTSNSGGLVYSIEIIKQSFQDSRIWIDTQVGTNGIEFPIGTPTVPCDNVVDASFINASLNNVNRFAFKGTTALSNGVDFSNTDWKSSGPVGASIDLNGVNIDGSHFHGIELTGAVNGRIEFDECMIGNMTGFDGKAKECSLFGNITLNSVATQIQCFTDCVSAVPGTATPIVDINGANCPVQFRNYCGGIEIRNFNQGNNMSIDVLSGNVILHSSCTSGTIVVRGVCSLTDNSNGCNVITTGKIELKPLTKGQFIALS